MSHEGEEDWHNGSEEDGEFTYAGYAESTSKTENAKIPRNAPTEVDADANSDAHGLTADAFLGKHCPICLSGISSSSVIDSCQHVFCKSCLFEWLEVSDQCPLCKTRVSSVLHDIKSPKDYQRHVHVPLGNGGGGGAGRIAERAAEGAGSGGRTGVDFRATIYRRGLAAEPPDQKARRPKSLEQLRPWIAREVQAAAPGTGRGDTRLVADVVAALLATYDVDTQEGYCAVKEQDFLFENTTPFLHELWCFRWSKASLTTYDHLVVYNPRQTPLR